MSDSPTFWNAYRAAIKNALLPGVPLPRNNEIFSLPFTASFTDSTVSLTTEAVNYLLYNLANTTRAVDGSTGHYAEELNIYLSTVDQGSLLDPDAKDRLEAAERAVERAQAEFDQVEASARALYDQLPPPKPTFEQWVAQNYPPYAAAQRALESARTQYQQAYNAYWNRVNVLRGLQENLAKALDTTQLHQGYNMPVQRVGGNTNFVPSYSSVGLRDQLNDWIQRGGGEEQTFVEVKVDSSGPKIETIYLKLTTRGVIRFDINVGPWNVENVKTLYPNRDPGAPDVLNPKYARPLAFLLAYDPKLVVEIRDGTQTTKLNKSTTTNDKPYASVFGILGQHFPSN
ncbi:hypothetical protein H0H92_014512 [Tricholoma furcatifolium]|nr:hypothetical protein H0H92_014512 [Tricholoma furcatifolium]